MAGKADSVSSVSALACHIGGPNSVNTGQILLVYDIYFQTRAELISNTIILTPLNSILGVLGLLIQKELSPLVPLNLVRSISQNALQLNFLSFRCHHDFRKLGQCWSLVGCKFKVGLTLDVFGDAGILSNVFNTNILDDQGNSGSI